MSDLDDGPTTLTDDEVETHRFDSAPVASTDDADDASDAADTSDTSDAGDATDTGDDAADDA